MESKIKTAEEIALEFCERFQANYPNEPIHQMMVDLTNEIKLHTQQYKSRCEELEAQRKDWAQKILKARDAFVEKDYDDVWHFLYQIASPNYDKTNPWEDLENIALPLPEKPE